MHATADRLAVGTAERPTTPDLFALANALAVDAAELQARLDDEPTISPSTLATWARADRVDLDTIRRFLDRRPAGSEVSI